jgi:ATPase subunit of ABC transporter with duplicated ATPase domains
MIHTRLILLAFALLAGCATPSVRTFPLSDHFNGERFFNPDGVQGSTGEQKQGPVALLRNLVKPPYRSWPKVPVTPTRPPARVEGLTKSYGERTLFSDLQFELRRGNRVAVLGANGSGKSTLLRVLLGEEKPDSGEVAWASGASVVSYNRMLDELDNDDTVTHAVNAMPGSLAFTATRKSVARFLSMFQFSEADLKQRIGNLSGGQRARVAMAQCLLSGASVLVLDEPTNHLDVSSTQVMERALVHFPGAVIVVSHDRFFTD